MNNLSEQWTGDVYTLYMKVNAKRERYKMHPTDKRTQVGMCILLK